MNLTTAHNSAYAFPVTAQSVAGSCSLNQRAHKRSPEALFLRPQFMAGVMGASSDARFLFGRPASPVASATLFVLQRMVAVLKLKEDTIMTQQNLVPVFTGDNGTTLCNARDLHTVIGSEQQFADWIKNRIEKYSFTEGEDFFINLRKSRGRPATDYHLTLDMAKELAMVENNEKGRAVRRYFIECEKKAKSKQLSLLPSSPTFTAELTQYIETTATQLALTFRGKCAAHLTKLAMQELERYTPEQVIERLKSWPGQRVPIVLLRDDVAYVRSSLTSLIERAQELESKLKQEII